MAAEVNNTRVPVPTPLEEEWDTQELLSAIVETSEDTISVVSPTGLVLTWIRGAGAMLGMKGSDYIRMEGESASRSRDAPSAARAARFAPYLSSCATLPNGRRRSRPDRYLPLL